MTGTSRRPAGTPAGGQFASTGRPEPSGFLAVASCDSSDSPLAFVTFPDGATVALPLFKEAKPAAVIGVLRQAGLPVAPRGGKGNGFFVSDGRLCVNGRAEYQRTDEAFDALQAAGYASNRDFCRVFAPLSSEERSAVEADYTRLFDLHTVVNGQPVPVSRLPAVGYQRNQYQVLLDQASAAAAENRRQARDQAAGLADRLRQAGFTTAEITGSSDPKVALNASEMASLIARWESSSAPGQRP